MTEDIPAQHRYLIEQLTERGFVASFRQWVMGDTVWVCSGEVFERPSYLEGQSFGAFKRCAYLVPMEDGLWLVDLGSIGDDSPAPMEAALERVTLLLRDQDTYDREFRRRVRAFEGPEGEKP
jgi:hypothetical protein